MFLIPTHFYYTRRLRKISARIVEIFHNDIFWMDRTT